MSANAPLPLDIEPVIIYCVVIQGEDVAILNAACDILAGISLSSLAYMALRRLARRLRKEATPGERSLTECVNAFLAEGFDHA